MHIEYVKEGTEGAKKGVSGKWYVECPDGKPEPKEKPKRKRRTKAEMEADKEAD